MTRRNRFEELLRRFGNRPSLEPTPAWSEDDREGNGAGFDADASSAHGSPPRPQPYVTPGPPLHWKEHLESLRHALESTGGAAPTWRAGREILHVSDADASLAQAGLVLDVCYRDPKKRGGWTQVRRLSLERRQLAAVPDPEDRRLLALLAGGRDPSRLWMDSYSPFGVTSSH